MIRTYPARPKLSSREIRNHGRSQRVKHDASDSPPRGEMTDGIGQRHHILESGNIRPPSTGLLPGARCAPVGGSGDGDVPQRIPEFDGAIGALELRPRNVQEARSCGAGRDTLRGVEHQLRVEQALRLLVLAEQQRVGLHECQPLGDEVPGLTGTRRRLCAHDALHGAARADVVGDPKRQQGADGEQREKQHHLLSQRPESYHTCGNGRKRARRHGNFKLFSGNCLRLEVNIGMSGGGSTVRPSWLRNVTTDFRGADWCRTPSTRKAVRVVR